MANLKRKYMQNYYFNIITRCSLFVLITFISSCKDVFEDNITDSNVIMIIPQSMDTLVSNQVHFKWEELEGASEYELHIVTPNFGAIQKYILDSIILDEEFKIILAPGLYEYKIKGRNSAYSTSFSLPRSFFIDSISDLSQQLVQLSAPQQDLYTNQMEPELFVWQNLFFADFYTFQLWNGSSFGQGAIIHQENTFGVTYDFNLTTALTLEEGFYSWGIKAVNQTSESEFNARSFAIDTTAPNNAILSLPVNNYNSPTNQVTLKWTKGGADFGFVQSPVMSNIEISFNDSLFSAAATTQEKNISADSLQKQFLQSGDYWWRVYLSDEAGNESYFYSLERKFTIP